MSIRGSSALAHLSVVEGSDDPWSVSPIRRLPRSRIGTRCSRGSAPVRRAKGRGRTRPKRASRNCSTISVGSALLCARRELTRVRAGHSRGSLVGCSRPWRDRSTRTTRSGRCAWRMPSCARKSRRSARRHSGTDFALQERRPAAQGPGEFAGPEGHDQGAVPAGPFPGKAGRPAEPRTGGGGRPQAGHPRALRREHETPCRTQGVA